LPSYSEGVASIPVHNTFIIDTYRSLRQKWFVFLLQSCTNWTLPFVSSNLLFRIDIYTAPNGEMETEEVPVLHAHLSRHFVHSSYHRCICLFFLFQRVLSKLLYLGVFQNGTKERNGLIA
jgi:hypothetical protein